MAKASNHQFTSLTKALIAADSGAGKTGALVSLVQAGYNLRIVDFDSGLDYLLNNVKKLCPEKLDNISYITCTDKLKSVNGAMLPSGSPKAFSTAMKMLTHWKDEDEDLGQLESWTPKDVLVLDSLTFMGTAALRHVLALNGRSAAHPQIQDWGDAMGRVESCLGLLYGSSVPCNVIVTAHVVTQHNEDGIPVGQYPSAIGSKLPPKVGRYFNNLLTIKRKGTGKNERRVICTTSQGLLECKGASPNLLPEYPIATGLADIFKTVQGGEG